MYYLFKDTKTLKSPSLWKRLKNIVEKKKTNIYLHKKKD